MNRFLILTIISAAFIGWSQDYETVETVSCKISMSIVADRATLKDVAGTAVVEVKLVDKAGKPIAGQEIAVQGTAGTLLCRVPGDTSKPGKVEDDRTCFTTDENGKSKLYFVNIPFNTTIRVKATSQCGDFEVHATGSVAVTRGMPRKQLVP
jgi:hypothetical protein